MKKLRILFMGTPDFAVESLRQIIESGHNVVSVVTMPDKPAGRGQQIIFSPVKKYALENNLQIIQPEKLKSADFISTLSDLEIDLGVVVAFRMLPEIVWNLPKLGTINLHGSLLPQYRGAAPINWAIINGETETGYTVFQLQQQIDTGDILGQETMSISDKDNAGTIHDKMMVLGANLLVKVINGISESTVVPLPQINLEANTIVYSAPKIFRETCQIKASMTVQNAHNLIRGLSPYPAAWTILQSENGEQRELKLFESEMSNLINEEVIGTLVSDNKNYIKITFGNGTLSLLTIQPKGKRLMQVKEYLAGNKFDGAWKVLD